MEEKVTTTLRLSKQMYKALKVIAVRNTEKMSTIVEKALAKYFLSDEQLRKELQSALGEGFLSALEKLAEG